MAHRARARAHRPEGGLHDHRRRGRCGRWLERGVSRRLGATGPPLRRRDSGRGDVRTDGRRADGQATVIADAAGPDDWQTVTWGSGTSGPLTASFAAARVRT